MERVILERSLKENAEEELLGERRGDDRDEETKEKRLKRPRGRTGTDQEAGERVLSREVSLFAGFSGRGKLFGVDFRRVVGSAFGGRRDGLNVREVGEPTFRKERNRVDGEEREENRAANENAKRRADAPRNEAFRRLRRGVVLENVADESPRTPKERDV